MAIASLIFGLLAPLGSRLGATALRVLLGYSLPGFLAFVWLLGAALLAVIFGHLGWRSIRRSEGRLFGKTMAVCGLVLGYAALGFVGLTFSVIIYIAVHPFGM